MVRAVSAVSRILIAQATRAPDRLEALFKVCIAAMAVMAADADGTPWIFRMAMSVMPGDRRALSCSPVDVDIFPTVAAAAVDIAHDRPACVCGRDCGRPEEGE